MRRLRAIGFVLLGGCIGPIDCSPIEMVDMAPGLCPEHPINGQPCPRYNISCPVGIGACYCGSDLTWYCEGVPDFAVPDLARRD
jgi:hypothetical protein